MKDDLRDALVPVVWAQVQIPVLKKRLLAWNRSNPFKVIVECDPHQRNRELLVALLEKPLDPLIIGDVGAIINSVRTGLDLMMAAVVKRHGKLPSHAPSFPIREKRSEFLTVVEKLVSKKLISSKEAAAIKRAEPYATENEKYHGFQRLFNIAQLDNLRKHQRLLYVRPIPEMSEFTDSKKVQRLMIQAENRTILYRVPAGTFLPTEENTNLSAEIYLFEKTGGKALLPAINAVSLYVRTVRELIENFP